VVVIPLLRRFVKTEEVKKLSSFRKKSVLRRFLTGNEGKKGKEGKTDLKKTGTGPIFELTKNKNRRSQCRSICTILTGNTLSFSDFEGDLTPSDFELNFHSRFAKTYACRFSITVERRPPAENEKALRISRYDRCGGEGRDVIIFQCKDIIRGGIHHKQQFFDLLVSSLEVCKISQPQ